MTNVVQLRPDKVSSNLGLTKYASFRGSINLQQERDYLHLTLDNTLEALAHMSPYQKYETFKGLAESMKTTFDLYMAEKVKGKL